MANLGLIKWSVAILICVSLVVAEDVVDETRRASSGSSNLKVRTTEGSLLGKFEQGHRRPYEAYYGIPFAAPPVGALRFKKPLPPAPYGRLWNSTYHRKKCIQHVYGTDEVVGSEDCLYLNIYRPSQRRSRGAGGRDELLPVIVFLHGGAFKFGTTHPKILGPVSLNLHS